MRHLNEFVAQTALDYDMSYDEVQAVYDKHPDNLYEALEDFINERKAKHED